MRQVKQWKSSPPNLHLHGMPSTSVICLNYESTSAHCATTNCATGLTVIRSTKQNPMQKSRLRAYKYCAPTCFLSPSLCLSWRSLEIRSFLQPFPLTRICTFRPTALSLSLTLLLSFLCERTPSSLSLSYSLATCTLHFRSICFASGSFPLALQKLFVICQCELEAGYWFQLKWW